MVLVARNDLQLSKGKLAAQCSHAAAECILAARRIIPRELDRYMSNGARKVVCKVDDLVQLKKTHTLAKKSGLVCTLVKDAGHTEIPPGTVTVLGIGPAPRAVVDVITGDLKLL